jgi:putative PIN family toxin of toxin-antitoxin system
MRLFLDTNVFASALMGRGLCHDLLDRIILDHTVVLGAPVQVELHRILLEKFHIPLDLWRKLDAHLRAFEQAPTADMTLDAKIPDADDIPVLACAAGAKVDVIVTGDKALPALGSINGIPILSPRETWLKLTKLNV